MPRKILIRLLLLVLAAFGVVLLAHPAPAQPDVNISDRTLIQVGEDMVVPANQVLENAMAIGGDVTLEEGARVMDTAIAVGGDVVLEENARIDGDAYAVGGDVVRAEGASIGGDTRTFTEQGRWIHGPRHRGINGFGVYYISTLVSHLLTVALSAMVGAVLLRWRPAFLLSLAETVRQTPLQCILWGLGGIVLVIALIIFLTLSLVGIPLLPLVALAVAIAVLIGTLGVALWIGEQIWSRTDRTPMQKFFIGLLVLALIGLIPWLGGLILSVANLVGFGALVNWFIHSRQMQPTA